MTKNLATLAQLQAHYGPRYRWLLLLAVMTGTVASIMSSTIVNVAIPDMSRQFALSQGRAQWVSSGFMVAMTIAMLTTPWLLERFGYRRTYVGTMLLLMAGGISGGLANQFSLVLAARVAEGIAAGAVQPIPVIILMRAFASDQQGRASGIFGMGVVLAPAIGPSVGGLLVDWFGWRSIFFMVVPFCLLSIWMAYRYVPVTAAGGAEPKRDAELDWRGLLLGGAATLLLLNALGTWHAGNTTLAWVMGLATPGCWAAFMLWQRHMLHAGREPLVNLALFRQRQFAMGNVVAFIYGTALFGSTYLLPVYMQLGLGLSASYVGGILLPAGLTLAVTIGLVGRLADRRHSTHLLVSVGLVLLAASFALMVSVNLGTSVWVLALWAVLGRIGLGFILPSLNLGSLRHLHKHQIAQGSSVINFTRMLGGAIGVSLCGIMLDWRVAAHGDTLTERATSPARLAAFDEVFLMLAVLCASALLAAWRLKDAQRKRPLP